MLVHLQLQIRAEILVFMKNFFSFRTKLNKSHPARQRLRKILDKEFIQVIRGAVMPRGRKNTHVPPTGNRIVADELSQRATSVGASGGQQSTSTDAGQQNEGTVRRGKKKRNKGRQPAEDRQPLEPYEEEKPTRRRGKSKAARAASVPPRTGNNNFVSSSSEGTAGGGRPAGDFRRHQPLVAGGDSNFQPRSILIP